MPAIITNQARLLSADYFVNQIALVPTYLYIGGVTTAWDDENDPPAIKDSTKDQIMAFDEFYAGKRIQRSNIVPVTRRINWTIDTVFDEYNDVADLINELNDETLSFYNFYVLTSEFNIYKCISNNNRTPSTIMPSGTSINSFQTPDGYIWKYMYSLNSEDVFGFLTANWMPCYNVLYNNNTTQWQTQQAAVGLTVDHVVVTDNGTGYLSSNAPTVAIVGDGVGATAVAVIDDDLGEITNIIITNKGSGYTTASVTITGGVGVGATATAIISPINGHGWNARQELGAHYVMIKADIEGTEEDYIPTDTVYRRINLVSEPLSDSATGVVVVVTNPEQFSVGNIVDQDNTGATGTIHAINIPKGYLYLSSVAGTFNTTDIVSSYAGNETTPVGILTSQPLPVTANLIDATDVIERSGDLLYFSTRAPVLRNEFQNESIRFIVTF